MRLGTRSTAATSASPHRRLTKSRRRPVAPPLWATLIGTALLVSAADANAHVRLIYPTSRHPVPDTEDSSNVKDFPCGQAGDSRTTDPNRITVFEPGETITVHFRETVEHLGHFRIALDLDGQDDFEDPASVNDIELDPVLPVLVDGIEDAVGPADYEQIITLPDVECENCTLQLMQIMSERPAAPFYYQCADIAIRAGASSGMGGEGPGAGTGGTLGTGGAFGTGGAIGTGGAATGTGGLTATGGSDGFSTDSMTGGGGSSSEGGCSFSPTAARSARFAALATLLLVGSGALRRRRRDAGDEHNDALRGDRSR